MFFVSIVRCISGLLFVFLICFAYQWLLAEVSGEASLGPDVRSGDTPARRPAVSPRTVQALGTL